MSPHQTHIRMHSQKIKKEMWRGGTGAREIKSGSATKVQMIKRDECQYNLIISVLGKS